MLDVKLIEPTSEVETPPASPRQVALGILILFQLAFIIGYNLLGLAMWIPTELSERPKQAVNRLAPNFADKSGHLWQWCEQLETNWRRWSQVTGQDQNWGLFSTVGQATGFPGMVLIWDEPNAETFPNARFTFDEENGFDFELPDLPADRLNLVLSDNEPADIHNFVRIGKFRLRRYEGQVYLNPQASGDEELRTATWLTGRVHKLVYEYHDTAHEYLRWRLKNWQRSNPDRPTPRQIILVHRLYRIHGPEEPPGWDGPFTIPLARWQPGGPHNDRYYPLEPFDFNEKRFAPISR